VAPGLAAIARQLDEAVVGAYPDPVALHGRRGDGADGAVTAGAGARDRDVALAVARLGAAASAARRAGAARGSGQIGADRLPVPTFVEGAEQHLRALVERIRRHGREGD